MLYVEHSCITIPLNRPLTASETSEVGHIGALQVLMKGALAELPNTAGCKGPVEGFPTCCLQSFGSYYSAVFAFLPKELNNLFESSLVKSDTADSIEAAIELLCCLVTLFGDLCDLTKENPVLVRKPYLLSQLKGGTRFMEIFVARAVPYLQKHFQQHNGIVITIIKEVQKSTRQLGRVIAHGKREKDANLAKETPRAKKILETFMHTVKRLFRKNRCMTAICELLYTCS
jgi:Fanconi anemia group D2 protein